MDYDAETTLDHIDFWVGSSSACSFQYAHAFGLRESCSSGLESGQRLRRRTLLQTGDVRLLFTSAISPDDQEVHSHVRKHGDGVRDVALRVSNLDSIYQRAIENGAISIQSPQSISQPCHDPTIHVRTAIIRPPFAPFVHTLIERKQIPSSSSSSSSSIPSSDSGSDFLPNFVPSIMPLSVPSASSLSSPSPAGSSPRTPSYDRIDHVAIGIEKGTLQNAITFYCNCFGFQRFMCSDDEDSEHGLSVSNSTSGLTTMVVAPPLSSSSQNNAHRIKFVIVEPNNFGGKSQVQDFLDHHCGPGILHLALHTSDILAAVGTARQKCIPFIPVPSTYYEAWKTKEGRELVAEDWNALEALGILIDTDAQRSSEDHFSFDHSSSSSSSSDELSSTRGYLLQTFTAPLHDRPTFYMEIICRRKANGFGRGNISALYEATELLQKKREAGLSLQK